MLHQVVHSTASKESRKSNQGLRGSHILRELLGLCLDVLDGAGHVESGLGEGIMRARKNLLEGADGVFERDELALGTREDLGNLERLGHETLTTCED